jgi:hypothetical protein
MSLKPLKSRILGLPEDYAACGQSQILNVPAPDIQSRQIHHTTPKRVLIVPGGFTCALHVLQHTLEKMVAQKFIKRTFIGVSNMIELQGIPSNIIVAGDKRNYSIPEL